MVTKLGMSEKLGLIAAPDNGQGEAALSPQTRLTIDSEVAKLLQDSLAKAEKIIAENRTTLDAMAQALVEKETLTDDEIKAILDKTSPKAP